MASDDAILTDEAITRWHALARRMPDDDPGLQALRAITYGGRRAATVVRPALLTRPRYEAERLAVALVGAALAKTLAAVHREPALLDGLNLSAMERDLVSIDPGFENIDVNDRFDAFLSKRLGFVEVQGASPGGMGITDAAARAIMQTAPYATLAAEFSLEPLFSVPHLEAAMRAAWADWGGTGDPSIAIVDWADAPLMTEFELIRDELRRSGLDTVILDPQALRFEGGRLRHAGGPIDLVYRRLTTIDILARPDETAPIVAAHRAGAVCLINPFASDVLGHKAIFDLLGDPSVDLGLTRSERAAIVNHVPWTRRLCADDAPAAPDSIARRWALAHRTSVALKPSHDFGGHGVTLGWECDDHVWTAAIDEALEAGDHLVQRRITDHRERFPRDEPGFPLTEFVVDTDPYVFRGRMGGMLVRLGLGGVTNITAGGSMTPAFILGPA